MLRRGQWVELPGKALAIITALRGEVVTVHPVNEQGETLVRVDKVGRPFTVEVQLLARDVVPVTDRSKIPPERLKTAYPGYDPAGRPTAYAPSGTRGRLRPSASTEFRPARG